MELKELSSLVRELAIMDETDAPFISCYLNLADSDWKNFLENRLHLIKKTWPREQSAEFETSVQQIHDYLSHKIVDTSKGVALFVRAGEEPYFKALQFLVSTENWLDMDTLPSIYNLVQLKDSYHRFVIVLSNKESARILEVNLGAMTEAVWTEKPELRQRVGREWTKIHYQNHRRDRARKHFKEKVAILEQLVAKKQHTHLILAGNPEAMHTFAEQLPKHLKDKLVDLVKVSDKQELSVIIAKTLSAFVEQEQQESMSAVDRLKQTIAKSSLAVCGKDNTIKALETGQADLLVIEQDYPDEADREEIIRLAASASCKIETVKDNESLKDLGSVGCFLRYQLAS